MLHKISLIVSNSFLLNFLLDLFREQSFNGHRLRAMNRRRWILDLNQNEKQYLLEAVRMMSEFFWGPNPKRCRDIFQGNIWEPIEEILPRLNFPEIHPLDTIRSVSNSFPDARTLYDALEEEYIRLFISNHHGICTPLYASCYREAIPGETSLLMGEPALEMRRRLESSGLSLDDNIGEPPDHLSIELEYLYFLLNRGWTDEDPKLSTEAAFFSEGVMLPWVLKLQQRLLVGKTAGLFYPPLITLLIAILRLIGRAGGDHENRILFPGIE
jgi:putative dimethyl sulfoxide reductase chaperone